MLYSAFIILIIILLWQSYAGCSPFTTHGRLSPSLYV